MKKFLRKNERRYPMVLVKWLDSYSGAAWIDFNNWAGDKMIIRTVGILLAEDKEHYRIAQSLSEEGKKDNWICIPRRVVLEIHELRKYNARRNRKSK